MYVLYTYLYVIFDREYYETKLNDVVNDVNKFPKNDKRKTVQMTLMTLSAER